MLNVLIVDDSITYRAILSNVLKELNSVTVAGTASNGKSALLKLQQGNIDLVLLDIEMPEMDGLETLKAIKNEFYNIGVVMVSGTNRQSTDITIRALEAGALDFVPKPDQGGMQENVDALKHQLGPIFQTVLQKKERAKGGVKSEALANAPPPETSIVQPVPVRYEKRLSLLPVVDVVVVGISTGGPNALGEFLPKLPGNLGVPVLLVQHMPPVFTASLASNLAKKSALTVKEAVADEPVLANTVYIAPGGTQMSVESKYGQKFISVSSTALPENNCKPSVDYLFRSAGKSYGKNILAIVMTGMGQDGAKSVASLKQSDACYCMTQTEDSCVIYGMPKAVDALGLSDEKVSLANLASRVTELCFTHSAIRMK